MTTGNFDPSDVDFDDMEPSGFYHRGADTYEPTRRRRSHFDKSIPVACKFCGAQGLRWKQVKGGTWRICRGNKAHICPPKENSPEGFTDVD